MIFMLSPQERDPRRKHPSKKRRRRGHGCLTLFLVVVLLLAAMFAGAFYWLYSNGLMFNDHSGMLNESQLTGDVPGTTVDPETGEEVLIGGVSKEEAVIVRNDELNPNQELGDEWRNILLLGCDARSLSGSGRTDSIIILSFNTRTAQAKLTSIMRDTWVDIPGKSGKNKINAANYYGGPNLAMKTINQSFGMNIEDYVLVNMSGLANIIDAIGGIEIPVKQSELKYLNTSLRDYRNEKKALGDPFKESDFAQVTEYGDSVHLNGQQAVAYARIRHLDSDYVRTERQRTVLVAIASKVSTSNIMQMGSIISAMLPHVQTNLDFGELVQLGLKALGTDVSGVEQMRLPVDGTFDSGIYQGTWSIRPNFEKNTQLLHEFIYGKEAE